MHREYLRHGVVPERLTVTPPVVEVDRLDTSPPGYRAEARLLFVGRLTRLKGPDLLLDALPLVQSRLDRRVEATIVGDGPDREALARAGTHVGIPVTLLGHRSGAEIRQLMLDTDLLVVPSVWPEPFGLVGIEAAGLGLPAAAFDVGGIADWLRPGVTGELAPGDPPTVQGLADAIVRALSSRSHHQELREGAWRHAAELGTGTHAATLEAVLAGCSQRREEQPS